MERFSYDSLTCRWNATEFQLASRFNKRFCPEVLGPVLRILSVRFSPKGLTFIKSNCTLLLGQKKAIWTLLSQPELCALQFETYFFGSSSLLAITMEKLYVLQSNINMSKLLF